MFKRTAIATTTAAALLVPAIPAVAASPAPMIDCSPVKVAATHNGMVRPNSTLAPIVGGKVLTIDVDTMTVARRPFPTRTGRWITAADGRRYAISGQWVRALDAARGRRQVASPSLPGGRVACSAKPRPGARAADTASYASDGSLGGGGYMEKAASTTNVSGQRLSNYATRDVCVNTGSTPYTHPDGAQLTKHPDATTWCFSYAGAGLNDMNGAERYSPAMGGVYIDDPYHRHFISYNGSTVAAAKRPSYYPGTCRIVPGSPIAWRTVIPGCNIAN